ncbi:MAG: exosortase A [Nitrospirota bacterium]
MEHADTKTFPESLKAHRLELAVTLLLMIGIYYSIVPLMVKQWYNDPNYSHGFLVPLIAGYFLYQRLDELKNAPVRPHNGGLLIILFGLLMVVLGFVGTEYFTMRASLVVMLIGLVLYLFGKDVLKITALPLGYLFFMVPLPYIIYDAVAFPLKLFVAKYSVLFLKVSGVIVWREGNVIMFPQTVLEVADACSGIRSIMSLLALSVALAFFTRYAAWKRWVIVLSAIPIAIVTNALRVIVTGFLAQYWGAQAAEGFFHEFAGLAVFGLAMAMLIGLSALLGRRTK